MANNTPHLKTIKRAVERTLLKLLPDRVAQSIGFLKRLAEKTVSYSQYGEDLILANYFKTIGIDEGVYVDIGCFHPTCISNTHLLHKRGWHGYAIDIDKYKLESFRLMRSGRCKTFLGAVVAHEQPTGAVAEVYKFRRLFWSEMDTLDRDQADIYSAELGIDYYVDKVPLIDVATFFAGFEKINLINIDIEGLDEMVLTNIDLDILRPEAILFEDNQNWGGSRAIKSYLEARGYERLFVSAGSVCYAKPPAAITTSSIDAGTPRSLAA